MDTSTGRVRRTVRFSLDVDPMHLTVYTQTVYDADLLSDVRVGDHVCAVFEVALGDVEAFDAELEGDDLALSYR